MIRGTRNFTLPVAFPGKALALPQRLQQREFQRDKRDVSWPEMTMKGPFWGLGFPNQNTPLSVFSNQRIKQIGRDSGSGVGVGLAQSLGEVDSG